MDTGGPLLQLVGHRASLADCLVMSFFYALGGAALGLIGGFAVAYLRWSTPDSEGWWMLSGIVYGGSAAVVLALAFAVMGFLHERRRGKRRSTTGGVT